MSRRTERWIVGTIFAGILLIAGWGIIDSTSQSTTPAETAAPCPDGGLVCGNTFINSPTFLNDPKGVIDIYDEKVKPSDIDPLDDRELVLHTPEYTRYGCVDNRPRRAAVLDIVVDDLHVRNASEFYGWGKQDFMNQRQAIDAAREWVGYVHMPLCIKREYNQWLDYFDNALGKRADAFKADLERQEWVKKLPTPRTHHSTLRIQPEPEPTPLRSDPATGRLLTHCELAPSDCVDGVWDAGIPVMGVNQNDQFQFTLVDEHGKLITVPDLPYCDDIHPSVPTRCIMVIEKPVDDPSTCHVLPNSNLTVCQTGALFIDANPNPKEGVDNLKP